MIVYRATAQEFVNDCTKRSIGEVIEAAFKLASKRSVGLSEVNSWASSLTQVSIALNDDMMPKDMGVTIEYSIPQSSKRMDVVLSGYGADGKPVLMIIELKQWSSSQATDKDGIVIARRGGRARESEGTHPSYQAWSYAQLLRGFNEAVYSSDMRLQPCAYLHNHPADGTVDSPFYAQWMANAPLFLKGEQERTRLKKFITDHIKIGDACKVIEAVEEGQIRPSKALADSLGRLLKGSQEFVLVDDQKVIYEAVLATALTAGVGDKQVIVVEGGPGTGKSVIAVNLLVALTRRGLFTKYVSKNAAPRAVYKAKLTGTIRPTEISNLFSGSGAFIDTAVDAFGALIVDEAHRLNEKSGLYGNLGENQIKELIQSARCSVFFVDESQRVTLSDVGRVAEIRKWADALGAKVTRYELSSQFRCSGSDEYIAWLDSTLGIRKTANDSLSASSYDFQVIDSPSDLHDLIANRNTLNNKARVVAGYCWKWESKNEPAAYDIVLEDGKYKRRWNLDRDGSLWIIAKNSVEEVGCIHTCQGLEVDYIGVILGPDLVVRNGVVRTDYTKRAKADRRRALSGIEGMLRCDPEGALRAADEIIKNTYRTLMTRGMKGCYVYSDDAETRDHFRSRLGSP